MTTPPDESRQTPAGPPGKAPPPRPAPGVILNGPDREARRVLLVGDPARLEPLRKSIGLADAAASITSADDYLTALGLTPRLAPDWVIGPIEGLEEMRDSIVTGFRRLAPRARLTVIAPAEKRKQAERAVEAGMDYCLIAPVTAADVAQLLSGTPATETRSTRLTAPEARPPAALAGPAPAGPAGAAQATRQDVGGRPPAAPAQSAASGQSAKGKSGEITRDLVDDAFASSGATEASASASGGGGGCDPLSDPLGELAAVDAELGDVDLIDQLMRDPAGLQALALRLIVAQSQIEGLAFCARETDVPPGRAAVPVEYHGKGLGVLHAPDDVGLQVLRPWASWLGHWLALGRKQANLWEMAAKDELTGAFNRRYFDRYLSRLLARAAGRRSPVTLLAFDIDNFKSYNDRYGHAAGDEILKQTVRLMRSAVREHDVVARIGGDEFAVIFWDAAGPRRPNSSHPDDVKKAAQRFQRAICEHHFPKLYDEAPGTLTISGGLASFPWDGTTPAVLLERADQMLLHSKRQGKNAITFGPGAARACELEGN